MITWVLPYCIEYGNFLSRKAIKEPIFVDCLFFLEESLNDIKKDELLDNYILLLKV